MKYKNEDLLFIDIETVSQYRSYDELPERQKSIWSKKHEKSSFLKDLAVDKAYTEKAAIFAEYGKVVCISIAYYRSFEKEYRLKSFYSNDEKEILSQFKKFCDQLKKPYVFCGHNIQEFDIPYLCRRFLINGLAIPTRINFQDKKPWEVELMDTMQLWKFGDYKNYTSLETLTSIFDIPTPKEDIDGSQVGHVYWEENDLPRIAKYCENDVIALIQLYQSFNQRPQVPNDKIKTVN